MNNTLQAVHLEYDNVCVSGDFNFPSIDWIGDENTPNLSSRGSVLLKDIMSELGPSQINDVIYNSAGNILDPIFTNIPEMITTVFWIFDWSRCAKISNFYSKDTKHKKTVCLQLQSSSEDRAES